MKKIAFWAVLILFCINLTGCLSISVSSSKDEEKILDAVKTNLEAFNNEDIDAYMSVISVPNMDEVKASTLDTFKTYDLKIEMTDLKVVKKEGTEAVVSCTQITKKISGPEFSDNKLTAINYLKKVSGKWKIYKTEVKDVEYL